MANWVGYPCPFSERSPLGEHAKWRCDTPPPPQKGYLSDTCAIPYENKANGCDTPLCDTISKGYCAIWGGISHWAAKRGPQKSLVFPETLHCDLRVRCKVASDLRFRVAISEATKPLLSAGFLAIWLRQRGNRQRLRLCDFGALRVWAFAQGPPAAGLRKPK